MHAELFKKNLLLVLNSY